MCVRRKKHQRKMVKNVIGIQSALVISVTGGNAGLLPVWTKKLYAKKIQIVAVWNVAGQEVLVTIFRCKIDL